MQIEVATEFEVLKWFYENMKMHNGNIGKSPDEYIQEYFENDFGKSLPATFAAEEGM